MATSYAPNIVSDGIVACWDAAGKRSYPGTGTTWYDVVGGNNGTLENESGGGLSFDSANGGSIVFDGTDDYVEIANESNFDIGTACTITAWVYLEGLGESNYGRIIDKGSTVSSTTLDGFQFHLDTGTTFGAAVGLSTTNAWVKASDGTLAEDEWVFIAMTFNEDSDNVIKLYKNGERITSLKQNTTGVGTIDNSSVNPRIGNYAEDTTRTFDGKIAVVSFYNRGLTAAEVLQNYDATKWRFQ